MPKLSAETRNRRRREILEAAARVLARRPGASMAQIASGSGAGRATLYRYFETRESLIRALALEALDRTDAACQGLEYAPTCEAMVRGTFERVIPLGADFHFLATEPSTYEDEEVMSRTRAQLEQTRQMVEWGKTTGELDPALPTSWLVSLIDGLIWTGWSAVAKADLPPDAIARLAHQTFWNGVRPRKEDP